MTSPNPTADDAVSRKKTTQPAFCLQEVLANVCGDREFLEELIADFQQQAPGLLQAIRTAAAERDGERLMREAHTLKGSVSLLAARPTFDAALELERRGRDSRLDDIEQDVDRLDEQVTVLLRELDATLANL